MPLIDMLKEAVLRTGCLSAVTSVAGHGSLPEHVLAERLLLADFPPHDDILDPVDRVLLPRADIAIETHDSNL